MQLPDEAIETAAIEYEMQIFGSREDVTEMTHRAFKADAKRILEAGAPLIAAQTLRSAADAWDNLQTKENDHYSRRDAALWLNDRAEALEARNV